LIKYIPPEKAEERWCTKKTQPENKPTLYEIGKAKGLLDNKAITQDMMN
jgi:hypothetical protein